MSRDTYCFWTHEIWPKVAAVYICIATDLTFKMTFAERIYEETKRKAAFCVIYYSVYYKRLLGP